MTNVKDKISKLPEFSNLKSEISFDKSIKNKTSFKIGGNADIFFAPKTYEQLLLGLNFFAKLELPISLMGGGTNLLVSDAGVEGVVVSLENFIEVKRLSGETLEVQAGIKSEDLSKMSCEYGLSGFENFAGLPGTVGGALYMNARCYNVAFSSNLLSAKTLKFSDGKFIEEEYFYNENDWAYKKSPFQNKQSTIQLSEGSYVIISAIFKLDAGDKKELEKIRQSRINDRTQKGHFLLPSCGSTFKNNHNFGKPSGAIIDELGLKGLKVGDAEVAPFHANFIVNNGMATAKDVASLIEEVHSKVKNKKGFDLDTEVIFAGRW